MDTYEFIISFECRAESLDEARAKLAKRLDYLNPKNIVDLSLTSKLEKLPVEEGVVSYIINCKKEINEQKKVP